MSIRPQTCASNVLATVSQVTMTIYSIRSVASARLCLQATASMISGLEIPLVTTTEAPTNPPKESLATAEADALLEFMDMAALTFIFMKLVRGWIHGTFCTFWCCLLAPRGAAYFTSSRYDKKLLTKQRVDRGLTPPPQCTRQPHPHINCIMLALPPSAYVPLLHHRCGATPTLPR